MVRSWLLPVGAWVVALTLHPAFAPTAEEELTNATIADNASLETNVSAVDITNLTWTPWMQTTPQPEKCPREGKVLEAKTGPVGGKTNGDIVGLHGSRPAEQRGLLLQDQFSCTLGTDLRHRIIFPRLKAKSYDTAVISASLRFTDACSFIKAVVTANVSKTGGGATTFTLYDDGIGADLEEDDGTYSATLLEYFGKGTYTVRVNAKSGSDTLVLDTSSVDSSRLVFQHVDEVNNLEQPTWSSAKLEKDHALRPRQIAAKKRRTKKLNNPFDVDADTVLLVFEDLTAEKVPPDRIHDLDGTPVTLPDGKAGVKLTWRSTGERGCVGTAHSYEVRMSLDHTAFEADFMSGEPVVVKLKPKPPRTMEELAISPPSKLPGKGAPGTNTVYIGLVIINNKQIRSQPSNIVNISLALKDGGLSPNDGSSPSNPGLPGGDLLKYAAITVGVVTLLACVVGLLCYCGAKRNARGNTGRVPAGAPIGASTAPLAGPPQHPGTTTTQLTSTATH